MSAAAYSDVRVAATVRFGGVPYAGAMLNSDQVPGRGYGGAGSVLLRASADGSTAYYVNLDPNLRLARIFKLQDGVFNPASSVLASVPLLLSHGVSYSLEAQAAGERLTVKLDGAEILAVDDAFPGLRKGGAERVRRPGSVSGCAGDRLRIKRDPSCGGR